ncbi:MAG: phage integrase SAM-like domain-containing protein [Bacteroidales bacterium]|nr:phage integrase SAM-like domain-containing protein [Bacteroidales bacterium]
MATFKPCVQKQRSDGFYPVYIRVTHQRKVGFIKTDKVVSKKGVTASKEIKDTFVSNFCTTLILDYTTRLNSFDTSRWSVKEVIDFLQTGDSDICFSDYARQHIGRLINNGQDRTARNYELALGHMERYFGTTQVMFSQLTSTAMTLWIKSLESTHRAKEMYPVCMRQVFRAAVKEMNDYDNDIIRIKTNPWIKVQIPQSDRTTKRAISAEDCRRFFAAPLPPSKMAEPLPELGHDIAKLVLCLAGMNTIDLYELKKEDYKRGRFCYKRAKTRHSRKDEAYFEMRIEPVILPIIEKYKADDDSPYFFNFHSRYTSADSFCANVNNGINQICKSLGLPKEKWYSVYTFRHTWATIAQNDCGANIAEVGFAMNHSHGHTVTRGYIKLDFTPAWELNAKVIDFVLFSTKKSKQGMADDIDNPVDKQFKLSPKRMVYARAYFQGAVIAEVTDIGFSNVDEVMQRLVPKFPSTIPMRSEVTFRIKDVDTDKEGIYVRTKGKGF